jgi:hypothetical protein
VKEEVLITTVVETLAVVMVETAVVETTVKQRRILIFFLAIKRCQLTPFFVL